MKTLASLTMALLLGAPLYALDLPGNARLTAETVSQSDRYAVPIAVFNGTTIPALSMDGAVQRQAWQIAGQGLTSMQMIRPLRQQLESDGFRVVLDCVADQCGGFDFRFGIEVLTAPAMYVNLSSFQFLTLLKGPEGGPDAAVTLLLSTTRDAAYIQIIEVTRSKTFASTASPSGPIQQTPKLPPVVKNTSGDDGNFVTTGGLVLEDLDFASGATQLGPGPFESLDTLAQFLRDNPSLQIALVGHTDSVGSLDGNIRISRRRAQSVRTRLIEEYGLNGARLEAEGAGYLSPIASNLTESGRTANRRVEAVILREE